MPLFDSADLLARCKRLADRPPADESPTDPDWYAWLTEAQLYWAGQIANHVPETQYTTELLVTADGGVSYSFAFEPLGGFIELRAGRTGRILIPGADFNPASDYVISAGSKVRFPGGVGKSFAGGLYARYVPSPGTLDGATPPSLLPTFCRALFVPRACYLWASQATSLADPQRFLQLEAQLWSGDPEKPGDVGILGTLKQQYFLSGAMALPSESSTEWWRYIDDGSGYTPVRHY